MDDIEKHLKAEGKIHEAHALIDDLLASDLKVNEPKRYNLLNWKTIGILMALFFAILSIWIWNGSSITTKPSKPENQKLFPEQSEPVSRDIVSNKELILQKKKTQSNPKAITPNTSSNLKNKPKEKNALKSENENIPNSNQKNLPKNDAKVKTIKTPNPTNSELKEKTKDAQAENNLIAYNFSQVGWGKNNFRSSSNTAPEKQKNYAKVKYNSQAYNEALIIIESLSEEHPDDWELIFYKGVCQLEISNKNTKDAILAFNKIIAHDDSPFIEDAEWMLAKAHLSEGNMTLTKKIIGQKILSYPSHKYYHSAKQLFDLLNK